MFQVITSMTLGWLASVAPGSCILLIPAGSTGGVTDLSPTRQQTSSANFVT